MSELNKDIFFNENLIGQFYDLNLIKEAGFFPTLNTQEFQFGCGVADRDKVFAPHIHKRVERTVYTTTEFLYVINGLMTVEIYSEDEQYVQTIYLKDNQAFLQYFGGHRISLQQGTKYFEIKQGPYYGRDFDKYEFIPLDT